MVGETVERSCAFFFFWLFYIMIFISKNIRGKQLKGCSRVVLMAGRQSAWQQCEQHRSVGWHSEKTLRHGCRAAESACPGMASLSRACLLISARHRPCPSSNSLRRQQCSLIEKDIQRLEIIRFWGEKNTKDFCVLGKDRKWLIENEV